MPSCKSVGITATDRLRLRCLHAGDAAFILELVNEPAWLEFIGDRAVRNLDDAQAYIAKGPVAMYERCGFGLFLVVRKDAPGDLRLARKAALATVAYGFGEFGFGRMVAITAPGNGRSIRLLQSLGFIREGLVTVSPGDPALCLFALNSHPQPR